MSLILIAYGIEKEIISIFKAAGDYPNCEASRRIQDNISDMQAQSAANAVGGELPSFFLIEVLTPSLSAVQIEALFEEFRGDVVIVGSLPFSYLRRLTERQH